MSNEHGERFHQEIKDMENWYQGRSTKNMLADYYWFLQRESDTISRSWLVANTFSQFTCPKISVLFTGSFQAVLFFC